MAIIAAHGACKEKQEAPAPSAKAPTAPAQPAPDPAKPSTPSAPTEATPPSEPRPTKPITIEEAQAALPQVGGTQIIALKQTSDQRQVHGTWCIDGTSADDVAKHVGRALAAAKYSGLQIRGDARKAGVTADRGEIRLSMVVSASSASICAAPAHYFASATIFKP
ncbi:MAG TPA: hypothetical protein VIV11_33570 [Kofleriaceae bacterium]